MKKFKNKPTKIILHCSATPNGRRVSLREIRKWHVEERGWDDIGYHFVIGLNGECWAGRSLQYQGAHTKGHNTAIGIAYVGMDEMNDKQEATFKALVSRLRDSYDKNFKVHGHCEFSAKSCPGFDVQERFGSDFCLGNEELVGPVEEEVIVEEVTEVVEEATADLHIECEEYENPDDSVVE